MSGFCCSIPYEKSSDAENTDVKCVILGDLDSAKGDLIRAFTTEECPPSLNTEGKKRVLEAIKITATIDGETIRMTLWDTPDVDAARTRIFPGTDVFLLCFSVGSHSSLEQMRYKFYQEVVTHDQQAPIIIVGTRTELRDDKELVAALAERSQLPITRSHAEGVAEELGAEAYFECSVKRDPQIVTEVFGEAARCGMMSRATTETSKCTIQ
mmetsp:Transcript_8782/g.13508  ORF Transcript_8782/g.13508 Transcript_8782/m.13508 type:complete len:211 (-) Transcript_8782:336-968(-)